MDTQLVDWYLSIADLQEVLRCLHPETDQGVARQVTTELFRRTDQAPAKAVRLPLARFHELPFAARRQGDVRPVSH
jgi:hypothetical protein